MLRHSVILLAVLAVGAVGCAPGSGGPGAGDEVLDAKDACAFDCGGKGDTFGIAEDSYEALGMLEVANTLSFEALDDEVPLHRTAAENIVAHRPVDSLEQLDGIPWVGPVGFERILRYAQDHGYVGSCGDGELQEQLEDCDPALDPACSDSCGGGASLDRDELADDPALSDREMVAGIREGSYLAAGVLRVANESSVEVLDHDVPLDVRAAENIVYDRPDGGWRSLSALDGVPWVGPAAIDRLADYAIAEGMVPYCGDGLPFEALEQCDDGNKDDLDGCTSRCEHTRACDDGMDDCDCTRRGCRFGWCDASSETCRIRPGDYKVHQWARSYGSNSLTWGPSYAWVGHRRHHIQHGGNATDTNARAAERPGAWEPSGVAVAVDPEGELHYVMGATKGVGPTAAKAEVGTLHSLGRRHRVDLGYAPWLITRARYVGDTLYAVLVGGGLSGGNSHPVHLLVESDGDLTHHRLASASDTSLSIESVDFRVADAEGHVEVLVVGDVHHGEAVAHLIGFDDDAGEYRRRRFVVETYGSRHGLEVGGAFDREGTPVVAVRRGNGDDDPRTAELGLHRFDGSDWTREALPDRARAGEEVALAFTRGNRPIVAMVGYDGGVELVFETSAGRWRTEVIDNPPWLADAQSELDYASVHGLQLVLDDLGRPTMSYTGSSEPRFSDPGAHGTYLFVPTP